MATTNAQGNKGQLYGEDFYIYVGSDGQFHIDFSSVVMDERVVANAAISKIVAAPGDYFWSLTTGANLLVMGTEYTPDTITAMQQAIVTNLQSENQIENVSAIVTIGSNGPGANQSTTVYAQVNFSVNKTPFSYDITINGQTMDVFVQQLAGVV